MKFAVASSPHHRAKRSTGDLMRLVMLATLPGVILQIWFFGWGNLVHFAIAGITAVVTEALILEVRKRDFERAIKDCSALLTALLLALCIPPFSPWWVSVIGTVFAIGIVKQLYGGLGYNVFNPAMAAYVMLLISFPVIMTGWLPPYSLTPVSHNPLDAAWIIFTGFTTDGYSLEQLRMGIDGHTMATPLDMVKTDLTQSLTVSESLARPEYADGLSTAWAWVNIGFLLGGLYLLKIRAIKWHIPVSMLAAMAIAAGILMLADSDRFTSPLFHLLSGGTMLGAFFIATDPVSASTTDRGRLWFGAGIGLWIVIIRTWGGYPDAIAFAVLVMNMAVPLIDYYTRPRTYGHRSEHKKVIRRQDEQEGK
ncbi:electron transport complex subunit RsxD [Aestuariibacter halophilus]|uniref:Ion-translocating oxidoreductase complex subunit D n=1 Tax=Fluctibacter halophilus TaxID=226011 RepID=A0ABS8G8D2_9ALTE|nr:electron transport complex subunit RsxD [Aestuariibacter halophilus]MCC2616793.1 electron transport complex subunit RsxD [Aestuariibacter halophilus]